MSIVSRLIATFLFAAWALSCQANEAVLRKLVSAYNAGDIAALPLTDDATLDGDAARARFAAKFAKAKHRMLILQLVRCSATRCTSNYYEATGPDLRAGSMTVVLGAFAIRSLQLRYPPGLQGPASFKLRRQDYGTYVRI